MAFNHHNLLSSLLLLSIILHFPARSTSQECQYPCYPPPTGGTGSGNNPSPVSTTPPSPTTGGSVYPPPLSTTPPSGNLPYIPPPGFVNGVTPPPPDPIVPWFPYYYRKPPHSDQSSSTTLQVSSRNAIVTTLISLPVFIFFSSLST